MSQGREAFSGASLRADMARIEAKPAIGSGWITASVPLSHDHVGPAGADDVQAERDRLGAGRAGAGHRVDARLGAELEADPGGGAVGHQHRHGVRADPARPEGLQDVVLGQQGLRAADAAAEADGEPLGVETGVLEAAVGPGLVAERSARSPRSGRAGAA
nr:hypothetical protein GCM10020092_089020 [Actinoplanes digitatis]